MGTSDRVLDFLGRRANVVGLGAALAAMGGTFVITPGAPLIALGLGALSYGAGFFLSGSSDVHLNVGQENEKVEVASLQRNLKEFRAQIAPHRKRLPDDVSEKVDAITAIFDEIIPQWGKINSFGDQKYTINAILTDYLPNTLQNYLNLPVSYAKSSAKKQNGAEVSAQLDILLKAMDDIRSSVFSGVERDIQQQTFFLQSRFVDSNLKLLSELKTD